MPKSPESPVFRLLTQKENLPAVLEITRYAEEIREYVVNRFWNNLRAAIHKDPNGNVSLSWDEAKPPDKSDGEFYFVARPLPFPEKSQGLRYSIVAASAYFGFGLQWNKKAERVEKLCVLEPVKALQAKLPKRGDIESEPNEYRLWWEYWQHNPYTDPWSWFGTERDDAFFNDLAEKFRDVVLPIHALALEANKLLSRSRS